MAKSTFLQSFSSAVLGKIRDKDIMENCFLNFKTVLGGVISLAIQIVILLYAYAMVRIMIDILNDKSPVHLNSTDFVFALGAFYMNYESFDITDNEYVKVELWQWEKNLLTGEFEAEQIQLGKCGKELFKYYNQTEVEKLFISDFVCPLTRDFTVQGNRLSEDFLYLELNILKCDPADCPADYEEVIPNIEIEIPFVNSYFDFDDYNDPVKTFIDSRLAINMLPGYLKRDNVFIQQNEAELQDGYFSYQPGGDQRGFIGVERVDSRLSVQQDSLSTEIYRMQFVKDAQSKFYERRVFSLLEVTGNIGGLFEILEKTGAILVSLFSGKVFIFSILSKLYHVEEPEGRYTNKISPFETEIKSKELAKCNYKNRISMHEIRNYTAQSLRSRDLFVNKAQKTMKRRLRYNWKISDFVYNFFHPLSTLL